MGGSRKLSCSTRSSSTAACWASPRRSTSTGATMGMTTKIISNASSTQAHSITSSSARPATAGAGSALCSSSCDSQASVPNSRKTRLKLVAPASSANSAPLSARLSCSTAFQAGQGRLWVSRMPATSTHPAVTAPSTGSRRPLKTPASSRTMPATVVPASQPLWRGSGGVGLAPCPEAAPAALRACHQATPSQSTSSNRAGGSAACRMSWVLTMRCPVCA